MLEEIKKFIYNNKIYSKCSKEEKDQIDSYLNATLMQIKDLKRVVEFLDEEGVMKCELNERLSKENKTLKQENKQLLERVKRLEDRLS